MQPARFGVDCRHDPGRSDHRTDRSSRRIAQSRRAGRVRLCSTARDEARLDSDVDIFIDIEPGRKFSLLDLIAMKRYLSDELGVEIDLRTRASLHPRLKDQIEREAIRIF